MTLSEILPAGEAELSFDPEGLAGMANSMADDALAENKDFSAVDGARWSDLIIDPRSNGDEMRVDDGRLGASSVPEPMTGVLALGGIAVLLSLRSRGRAA